MKLLEILHNLGIGESEIRIIRYLISNTTASIKINNKIGNQFNTTIGSPQGDALSSILFIVYREQILREWRANLPQPLHPSIILTGYVDDTNFITFSDNEMTKVTNTINQAFANFNMQENVDKRELSRIDEESLKGSSIKILGSLLNEIKDTKRRISLSNAMFYKIKNTWNNQKISLKSKIELYQHLIAPILKYNLAANGMETTQMQEIDTTHRNHLRYMANIKRLPPTDQHHITNMQLYQITNSHPISIDIVRARWSLFGHICRLDQATPARIAMERYFIFQSPDIHAKAGRMKPATSLPKILNQDLKKAQVYLRNQNIKLVTMKDLHDVIELAQDRIKWTQLVEDITAEYQDEQIRKQSHNQIKLSRRPNNEPRTRKWTDRIKDKEEAEEPPVRRRRINEDEMEEIINQIVQGDFMEI